MTTAVGLTLIATGRSADLQNPKFQSFTDVVAIDFAAVRRDGTLVSDLKREELILSVAGEPREIQSLQFVDLTTRALSEPSQSRNPLFQAGVSRRAPADGRAIILLFAHESIRPGNERIAIDGARRFISQLSPLDRVAVVTVPQGAVLADLTSDHQQLESALSQVRGHSGSLVPLGTRLELVAIADCFRSLREVPGRKVVVLISEGILPPIGNIDPVLRNGRRFPHYELTDMDDFSDIGRAAAEALIQVYVVQPNNFTGDASRRSTEYSHREMDWAHQGLGDFAAVTGGELFRLSGRSNAVFDRILRETSGYYLASVGVLESDRVGKSRRISLRVKRADVIVRARPAFVVPKS